MIIVVCCCKTMKQKNSEDDSQRFEEMGTPRGKKKKGKQFTVNASSTNSRDTFEGKHVTP